MKEASLVAFRGHGQPMEMLQRQIPDLRPGEILIRNLYTTLCGSDLHTYCGLRQEKVPTVLGHEIVGEIVGFHHEHDRKDYLGNPLNIGDRVTWSIFSSDPSSAKAKAGMPQKGESLFKYGHEQITPNDALHGGLSTHCILRYGTIVLRIGEEMPLKVAATINCAVATVAGALRMSGDPSGKKVLVTGSGLLGIVCTAMCKSAGAAEVHMADINPHRLAYAADFGAGFTHLLTEDKPLPSDIDIAFDMSGSPDAMEKGLATLAIGGSAIWIGAVLNTRPVQVNAENVIRKIITIKGLHNYNYQDFVTAVSFMTAHHRSFPFEQVVAAEFSLENAEQAFKFALETKPIRVGVNLTQNTL